MESFFSQSFYINNRQKLVTLSDTSFPIVITAHGLLQRGGDNTFPFHQESNFWYLTGIDEPDIVLVMEGDDAYLIVPGRSTSREAFDGAVNSHQLTEISGIADIMTEEEGWQRLGSALKKSGKVQTLAAPPAYIEQYGLYTNPARSRLIERLYTWASELEIMDIREVLTGLRMIKQPEELRAIQKAIDVTVEAIKSEARPERLEECKHEWDLEMALTQRFRTEYTSGHAFAPIVAGGKRACTLHNTDNSGELQKDDLVVIDVGAEASHYAADITRSVCYGIPTKRQQDVFDAVLDVQQFALDLLAPGTVLKEYEAAVEDYMGRKLQELGLIDEPTHENIRQFFPHATSHFLGLDVHDVGDYHRPLEPNMVLTCEPGIYISKEGIGVRIEDDVLITEKGNIVLSRSLPKTLKLN